MKRFSIRRRLLVLLLGSLMLVWTAMLAVGYYEARDEVNELADARLEQSARTLMLLDLKRLGRLADGQYQGNERNRDDRDGDDDAHKHLDFQVWSDEGELLLHSSGAPAAAFDMRDGYRTFTVDNTPWRGYALHDRHRGYQVRVFETMQARDVVIDKVAGRMMQLLLLALPILAVLVWIGIGRGLQPLALISHAIAARHARNLEPIDVARVPVETQPLIDSLNNLLQRLSQSIDRERSFTADAAHELRTPLAAIKVQAEVALAAQDEATRRHAIEQVIAGVNRTTHLARQLLLLARLDHADAMTLQPVDIGRMAADCIAHRAGEAAGKGIEFDLSAPPDCLVRGDPTALSVMLDNVIDNAVKYGKEEGHIVVSVAHENAQVVVSIKDDGPGVAPGDRPRLFDRFFRIAGSEAPGSGLGLSIVDKIARAYGGTASVGDGLAGRGLGVTIRLPTCSETSI